MSLFKNALIVVSLFSASMTPLHAQPQFQSVDAQTHVDVVDALLRFTNGIDTDNGELIGSAFTQQGVADFTPAAKKVGMQFPVLTTKETIVAALVPFAANYTTSHSVSNTRVEIKDGNVSLYALVEANHIPISDSSNHYMMKNQYHLTMEQEDGVWRISHMHIENLWSQGQLSVMTGK